MKLFKVIILNILIIGLCCFLFAKEVSAEIKIDALNNYYDPIYGTFKLADNYVEINNSSVPYGSTAVKPILHLGLIDESTKTIRILYTPYFTVGRGENEIWWDGKGPNILLKDSNPIAGNGTIKNAQPFMRYDYYEELYIPTQIINYLDKTNRTIETLTLSLFNEAYYMELKENRNIKRIDNDTLEIKSGLTSAQLLSADKLYLYGIKPIDEKGLQNFIYNGDLAPVGTDGYRWHFSYSAKLYSRYPGGYLGTSPAKGMGMNVKSTGTNQTANLLSVYYIPFYITITYEDMCDTVAAKTPSSSLFSTYWTKTRSGGRTYYTPLQQTMDCACGKDLSGDWISEPFHDEFAGGSATTTVRSRTLKVSCAGYTGNKTCSIADLTAGKLTTNDINQCCTLNAAGFAAAGVCDTTYDLYCDNPTTVRKETASKIVDGYKVYKSYTDELAGKNQACSVTCTESGRAVFQDTPFTIAGQGFGYDWDFYTNRSCVSTYKYTIAAWVAKYNGYVTTRVAAYKDWYDYSLSCPVSGRWTDTTCSYTCTSRDEITKVCTAGHWNSCEKCGDLGQIKVSTYNSNLSSKRRTYTNALATENLFLNDKKACDNWANAYNINGDFSLKIEEGQDNYSMYDMTETRRTTTNNSTTASYYENKNILNCGATVTSCSTYTSSRIYTTWTKYTAYTYTYGYPEESFIDRSTGEVTTRRPSNYYKGDFFYYTGLGTLTGDYELAVLMNNAVGFGAYNQWKLKNKEMACWYHLDNNLSPSGCSGVGERDNNCDLYGNLGITFRTVKLNNLFPDRAPGDNWGSEATLINTIETAGNNIYSGTPKYTIVLKPTAMKSVRNYNDDHEYTNWDNFKFSSTNQSGTSGFLKTASKYGVEVCKGGC